MRRNQLAKLTKHTELAYGWFGISFFHLRRVTELKSHANHFFLCFNQDSYGMAVNRFLFLCGSDGFEAEPADHCRTILPILLKPNYRLIDQVTFGAIST